MLVRTAAGELQLLLDQLVMYFDQTHGCALGIYIRPQHMHTASG